MRANIQGSSLYTWSMKLDTEEAKEWVQYRVIELEKTIPVANPGGQRLVVGFAEGVSVIFVHSAVGLFTVKLNSGQVKKVDGPGVYFSVLPYMSLYTPDCRAYQLKNLQRVADSRMLRLLLRLLLRFINCGGEAGPAAPASLRRTHGHRRRVETGGEKGSGRREKVAGAAARAGGDAGQATPASFKRRHGRRGELERRPAAGGKGRGRPVAGGDLGRAGGSRRRLG